MRRRVAAGLAAGLLLAANGTPADLGGSPRHADRPTESAAQGDEPQPSLSLMAAVLALVGLTAAWRMRAARENVPLARLAARMPPLADPGRVAAQRRADEAFRELRRIAHDARAVAPAAGAPSTSPPPVTPRTQAETADI